MKLKPSELRIGNYYLFTDKEGAKIEQVWFIQDCGFDLLNEGEASPVPLNRTRLIRLGFEHKPNDNNGGCYSRIIKLLDGSWSLEIWDYSSENEADFAVILKDLDVGKEVIIPIELQYVHTLQNLCHALTGTELTLNKEL